MLANVFTILELQFPETYKQASSNSQRWFGWKKHFIIFETNRLNHTQIRKDFIG